MRTLGGFCIALLCAGGLFAQHISGGGFQGRASHGSAIIPRWPYSGYGYGSSALFRPSYFYPVFVGGYYDYAPYGYGDPSAAMQQQPNVTVVNAPPQAQASASPVIINVGIPPGSAGPSGQPAPPQSSYQEPVQQQEDTAAAEPAHYLIALKDHTIYSAIAYWVDGSTLHYFTSGNTHNQISLSLVDRDLTQRLNNGSGLEVNLPPAK